MGDSYANTYACIFKRHVNRELLAIRFITSKSQLSVVFRTRRYFGHIRPRIT